MSGWGYEDSLRQPLVSFGMKGVKPENIDKLLKLITDTLKELAETGFSKQQVSLLQNLFLD